MGIKIWIKSKRHFQKWTSRKEDIFNSIGDPCDGRNYRTGIRFTEVIQTAAQSMNRNLSGMEGEKRGGAPTQMGSTL